MTMRNEGLTKTFNAGAAVTKCRIAKFGADERTVIMSALAVDAHVGIVDNLTVASGDPVDVILAGVATVEYGGTVTAGALLTADTSGRAIVATASAAANVRVIGVAMVAGVVSDLGAVLISAGSFQG
tara:strand:+ start:304 stop:684 length:381 start_codon:yes stop_codon:yes gene_type:complete